MSGLLTSVHDDAPPRHDGAENPLRRVLELPPSGGGGEGLSYVPYLRTIKERPGQGFASPELVAASAALFTAAERHRDGPRYWVEVAPGRVRLSSTGHQPPQAPEVVERGVVTAWSRKSRARMVATIAALDMGPVVDCGRALAMVTFTLPDRWLEVAPTAARFAKLVDNWTRRYERAWGYAWVGIWKKEFQRRGAPHLHALMAPPHGVAVCRCEVCGRAGRDLPFREWLSHAWAAVVNHPDAEERRKHRLAGTGVDWSEGARATDVKRLAVYFSKHGGAAGGKEYQHQVPDEWANRPGRFWGYRGLHQVAAAVQLEHGEWDQLKRTMRHWSERSAYFWPNERFPHRVELRTHVVTVQRVDARTGLVRYRKVRRRRRYLPGMAGGFVLPNNGPAFASALARSLEVR